MTEKLKQNLPDLYIQRVENKILSGVNLKKMQSFAVSRLPGTINITLNLNGGGTYTISFTQEKELEDFIAKLEKIID
jgi:hypothetical protein